MKIRLLLLASLLFAGLLAAGEPDFESSRGSRVSWVRLKFPVTGDRRQGVSLGWFYHPTGDVLLVDWLRKNTTINIKQEWNVVDVSNASHMCEFPMLFLSGKGKIHLNRKQKDNMKEYLLRGGFLFVDDCVALKQPRKDIFFQSIITLLKEILPAVELKQLPMSHPVFSCYYKIPRWEHLQGVNHGLYGAWYEGRLIALMDGSDLHCGWVGFHFNQRQREFSYKMTANIYVYTMNN